MQNAYLGEYDIEVELTLLPPEKGGRTRGLPLETDIDGPRLYLENIEARAIFTLQDREILQPGETARVFVTFVFPPSLQGIISPGKSFLLHECYHTIGEGHILSLLHFEKHVDEAIQREEKNHVRFCVYDHSPAHEQTRHRRPKKKKQF